MGQFERHLNNSEPLVLDEGKLTLYLKPLGTEYLKTFFKAMKAFPLDKDSKPEELLSKMDVDSLDNIATLIDATLKKSYPNEPEEELKTLGMKFMLEIFMKIMELNINMGPEQKRRMELITSIQKKNEPSATQG